MNRYTQSTEERTWDSYKQNRNCPYCNNDSYNIRKVKNWGHNSVSVTYIPQSNNYWKYTCDKCKMHWFNPFIKQKEEY